MCPLSLRAAPLFGNDVLKKTNTKKKEQKKKQAAAVFEMRGGGGSLLYSPGVIQYVYKVFAH